jgi:hypothetical protein
MEQPETQPPENDPEEEEEEQEGQGNGRDTQKIVPPLERRGKNMIRGNQYTNTRRGKHSRKWPPRP